MKKDRCGLLIPKRVTQNRVVKFDKVMWSNQGSESDAMWKREDYLNDVYPTFIQNHTLFKSRDEIFIRGEGCNTPGVSLAWFHLHFMIMSIIHSFMRIYHLKHVKHDHETNVTFQLFFHRFGAFYA